MKANYVYIMWTPKYLFLFKLGYSNNPHIRAQYIEKSMNNKYRVYIICSNRMYFALTWELLFHKIFFLFNFRVSKKVSGHTELYWFFLFPIMWAWVMIPECINLAALLALIYYFL